MQSACASTGSNCVCRVSLYTEVSKKKEEPCPSNLERRCQINTRLAYSEEMLREQDRRLAFQKGESS